MDVGGERNGEKSAREQIARKYRIGGAKKTDVFKERLDSIVPFWDGVLWQLRSGDRSGGGKFCTFTQHNFHDFKSAVLNSTTKFLEKKLSNLPPLWLG